MLSKNEMERFKKTCRICLETVRDGNSRVMDETIIEVLDVLLQKFTVEERNKSVMCKTCCSKLFAAFHFKATCMGTENAVFPCVSSANGTPVDLIEVYLKERAKEHVRGVLDNERICRLCMEITCDFTFISDVDTNLFREYIPEINFSVTLEPVICASCLSLLKIHNHFLTRCWSMKQYFENINNSEDSLFFIKIEEAVIKSEETHMDSEIGSSGSDSANCKTDDEYVPKNTDCSDDESDVCSYKTIQTSGAIGQFKNGSNGEDSIFSIKIEEMEIKSEETHVDSAIDLSGDEFADCKAENKNFLTDKYCSDDESDAYSYRTIQSNGVPSHLKNSNKDEDNIFCIKTEEIQIKSDDTHMDSEIVLFGYDSTNRKNDNETFSTDKYCSEDKSDANAYQTIQISSLEYKSFSNPGVDESDRFPSFKTKYTSKTVADIQMYKCTTCNFQTENKGSFSVHQLKHNDRSETKTHKHDTRPLETQLKSNSSFCQLKHKGTSQMYKCDKCAYETNRKNSLVRHGLRHKDVSELQMYKCNACSYESNRKDRLLTHLRRYKATSKGDLAKHQPRRRGGVSEAQMYKCDMCNYESKSKQKVARHQLIHKDASEIHMYKCDKCNFESRRKESLVRHRLAHSDVSEVRMYKCNTCCYESKRKDVLIAHQLRHRDSSQMQMDHKVRMYKCDNCSFTTTRSDGLRCHQLIHQDVAAIQMFKCDACNFETKHKRHLKRHQLTHEDVSEAQMYKCDECDFETKRKENLQRHQINHKKPSEVQMYKCDECDFETKRKENLRRHQITHKKPSEVQMYKCEECNFESKRKNAVVSHQQRHKGSSPVQIYRCRECNFGTKFKETLVRHKLKHKDIPKIQMYKCGKCSYESKYKNYLTRHQIIHKNEVQMYTCDKCTYKCKFKGKLVRHQLVHKDVSEVHMHKCDECNFESKYEAALARHQLTHRSISRVQMYKCDTCDYECERKKAIVNHQLTHRVVSELLMYKCDKCSYASKFEEGLTCHRLAHKDVSETQMYK